MKNDPPSEETLVFRLLKFGLFLMTIFRMKKLSLFDLKNG